MFLAFGIPAVVMSTDYCRTHSNARAAAASIYYTNREITYGTCDVLCEFALAFRSLASVLVYVDTRLHSQDCGVHSFRPLQIVRSGVAVNGIAFG